MIELIVRGEHDDRAEADGQREEALSHRVIPDARRQQLLPGWSDEVQNTCDWPLQRDGSHKKHDQDHVGEYRQEIGRLARALHTAYHHDEDREPADEERDRQTPVRRADAVVDVVLLSQDFLATDDMDEYTERIL